MFETWKFGMRFLKVESFENFKKSRKHGWILWEFFKIMKTWSTFLRLFTNGPIIVEEIWNHEYLHNFSKFRISSVFMVYNNIRSHTNLLHFFTVHSVGSELSHRKIFHSPQTKTGWQFQLREENIALWSLFDQSYSIYTLSLL